MKLFFKTFGLWLCPRCSGVTPGTCSVEFNPSLVRGLSGEWPQERGVTKLTKSGGLGSEHLGPSPTPTAYLLWHLWICSESRCPCLFPKRRTPCPLNKKRNFYPAHRCLHPLNLDTGFSHSLKTKSTLSKASLTLAMHSWDIRGYRNGPQIRRSKERIEGGSVG